MDRIDRVHLKGWVSSRPHDGLIDRSLDVDSGAEERHCPVLGFHQQHDLRAAEDHGLRATSRITSR
jgi:hypothetical protein